MKDFRKNALEPLAFLQVVTRDLPAAKYGMYQISWDVIAVSGREKRERPRSVHRSKGDIHQVTDAALDRPTC